jgi:hypothetical protein
MFTEKGMNNDRFYEACHLRLLSQKTNGQKLSDYIEMRMILSDFEVKSI